MPEADFSTWGRATLERFAREAADDNRELRQDLRIALDAYRAAVCAPPAKPATPDDIAVCVRQMREAARVEGPTGMRDCLQKVADRLSGLRSMEGAAPAGYPAMPPVDPTAQIGYEHIRYVPGFTANYVQQYARDYLDLCRAAAAAPEVPA